MTRKIQVLLKLKIEKYIEEGFNWSILIEQYYMQSILELTDESFTKLSSQLILNCSNKISESVSLNLLYISGMKSSNNRASNFIWIVCSSFKP